MAEFILTAPDGAKYKVTAPDEQSAFAAFKKMGGTDDSQPDKRIAREFGDAAAKADAGVRGFADTVTFGFADEIAGGFGGVMDALQGGSFSEGYKRTRDKAREIDAQDADKRGGYRVAGQVAGALTGGAGLAKGGLSLATNAARAGQGLGRVATASALEGGIMGAGYGAGSGTDAESRIKGGLKSGAFGFGVGAAAPYVVAGVANVAKPFYAGFAGRINPEKYANKALGQAVTRSGRTPNQITNSMRLAGADDQGVYMLGDALGHPGQRLMSTAARNPHDARTALIESLMMRQSGQGRRLVGAIEEGFDAPLTADKITKGLTKARTIDADIAYEAARRNAGPVNLTPAISKIDQLTKRNPILGESALTKTEIGSRLARIRSQMTAEGQQLVDFDTVLNLKKDMFATIQNLKKSGKAVPDELSKVYGELDKALEAASSGYRAANDAFRQTSKEIDAVGIGRDAATRGRYADTIENFDRMTTGEQVGHRIGYADRILEPIENNPAGVLTNKARPLISEATANEFPAFAAPGRAPKLMRQVAREDEMFQNASAALGGSKTADNLADASELSNFDPSLMSNLLRQGGSIKGTAVELARMFMQWSTGQSPRTIELLTRKLMETRPDVARQILAQAGNVVDSDVGKRALVSSILRTTGATALNPAN